VDKLSTYNEGLTVLSKRHLSNKSFLQHQYMEAQDCEITATHRHEDIGMRNLYSEIVHVAIRDLKKGLSPEDILNRFRDSAKENALRNLLNNRANALAWFRGDYEAEVSFQDCCEVLGINPSFVLRHLIAQKLMTKTDLLKFDESKI
jgi:hypothetical protein